MVLIIIRLSFILYILFDEALYDVFGIFLEKSIICIFIFLIYHFHYLW